MSPDELDDFTDQPDVDLDEGAVEPEVEAEPAPPKTVPLAALDEARNEARAAKQQAAEAQQKIELMNQRFQDAMQLVGQRQQAPQAEQPREPDFDDDPANNLNTRLARMEQLANGLQQQTGQQQALQQFMQRIQPLETQFVQQTPDYYDALQHVRNLQAQGMKAAGYSDQQIMQHLTQQELQLAAHAMQQGQSPAQAAYARAKAMGYVGKAGEAAPSDAQAKKALSELEKAQRAASGLDGGSTETSRAKSLEDLAELRGDELAREMDRLLGSDSGRSEVGALFND